MSKCAVCDAELQPEQKTCHICGSNVEAASLPEPTGVTNTSFPPPFAPLPPSSQLDALTSTSLTGEQECPACGQTFDADYQDEFCSCGTELQPRVTLCGQSIPGPTALPPISPSPTSPVGMTRPPVGTICLVVYSDTKPRQPVKYVPIIKDVLLIGREDAVRGDFPDLDLGLFLDDSLTKKVSRRHAEVLRARDSQTYMLRPFPGNTGTQVGKELALPDQHYPLTDGVPIVFGGVVWMKFETIK